MTKETSKSWPNSERLHGEAGCTVGGRHSTRGRVAHMHVDETIDDVFHDRSQAMPLTASSFGLRDFQRRESHQHKFTEEKGCRHVTVAETVGCRSGLHEGLVL